MTRRQSPRQNLKTQAYSILKEKIVNLEYQPGSMLNEAQLADELGFSRTPIREAISILEMEGFLCIVPKKGILVTDILLSDIVQIFQARMEIEPIALKLAGPRIPKDELLDCLLEQDFEKTAVKMRAHVAGCRNAALDFYYSA